MNMEILNRSNRRAYCDIIRMLRILIRQISTVFYFINTFCASQAKSTVVKVTIFVGITFNSKSLQD